MLEFIFPETYNSQRIDTFNVGNLPVQQEVEQSPLETNTENLYYSTDSQRIDSLVHTDNHENILSPLSS